MSDIAKSIQEKIGYPNLLDDLDKKLPGSDLNSLLLELFRMKVANTNPTEVLQQFVKNRFAVPSSVDAIEFKELEIKWLKEDNPSFREKLEERMKQFDSSLPVKIENTFNSGEYYQLARFRTYLNVGGQDMNLSDGGFVNWTQKLLSNKKHRLIISATGLELVFKLMQAGAE